MRENNQDRQNPGEKELNTGSCNIGDTNGCC